MKSNKENNYTTLIQLFQSHNIYPSLNDKHHKHKSITLYPLDQLILYFDEELGFIVTLKSNIDPTTNQLIYGLGYTDTALKYNLSSFIFIDIHINSFYRNTKVKNEIDLCQFILNYFS